jgi:aryl-alcohol dehydrogenase-like predicted oxidoreductase
MLIIAQYRKDFMGECSKEQSFALLDAFFVLGGNFLDTCVQ